MKPVKYSKVIPIEESAVNDTDRRHHDSSKGHLNTNHTSNPDNRNQTSEHGTGNQNHTLIDLKSNQTNSPDHESGILNHTPEQTSGYRNHTSDHQSDNRHQTHHGTRNQPHTTGGAIAGGVLGILIAFLLIGVFIIRRCRNKNADESKANEMNKTRSNPMYDPSEIQVDQEINNQRTYSENLPQNTALYFSIATKYDHLQSKEDKGTSIPMGGIQTTHIKGIRLPTIIYKAKMAWKISKLKRWKQMCIHI
ncbi:unnamed protein product [Mytilus edulis]|uniref:Uncharacterized protein n=1 Tax=Mytilus edulis TaxID=6550 RepID=A0A8S3TDH3_MYTED|nr:unnamed protein product [Mytilus edulis]